MYTKFTLQDGCIKIRSRFDDGGVTLLSGRIVMMSNVCRISDNLFPDYNPHLYFVHDGDSVCIKQSFCEYRSRY